MNTQDIKEAIKMETVKTILCHPAFRNDICLLDILCKKGEGIEEILEDLYNKWFVRFYNTKTK